MSNTLGPMRQHYADDDQTPIGQRGKGYSLKPSKIRERQAQVETLDSSSQSLRVRDEVIANAVISFRDEQHAVNVITTLWREAQAKFLAIGRNLREAKWRYPRAYEKTILPQLPFGRQVAFQLRTIAEAVDGKRFTEVELPHSYSAAYQLAILDDGDLKEARQLGLVRPEVQRRQIEKWKRERELNRRLANQGKVAVLRDERHKLHDESIRLHERLSVIVSRLTEVDNEIAVLEGTVTIEGQADETDDVSVVHKSGV
jgi:hypothetical protein